MSGGPGPGGPPTPIASTTPGPTPTPTSVPTSLTAIKHIVIIVQENRTPDNLFNGFPGADTQNVGINSQGQTIAMQPGDLQTNYDLSHAHKAFVQQYDGGKMDGSDLVSVSCPSGSCLSNPSFRYVPQSQVQPYWTMAQQYVLADRMFQTNQGPSYPAHQYLISGTSIASPASTSLVSENVGLPGIGFNTPAGCAAAAGTTVLQIDMTTGIEGNPIYPCFEHQTIMDLLDTKRVSWKYYAPSAGSIWTAPNSIAHLRNGPDWNNVIIPETGVLSDIQNNTLSQVSWVIPNGMNSDHPKGTADTGPAWVASIVNSIGASKYWNDTAIFITWDDWGGWYDHVAPPKLYNAYELGFRVPLIVVSPFAKHGYVSHSVHEFGSILKFTEETFGLGTLGYTDARADDLLDCFDFTQPVGPFRMIQSNRRAADFLRNPHPFSAPDSD